MPLKRKFIILFVSVSLVSILAFLAMEYLRKEQHKLLTIAHAESTAQTVNATIKNLAQSLDQVTFDYTYWDEMVRYVNDPDTAWANVNLATIIQSYTVHAVWAYNREQELVYFITGLYPGASRMLPLPPAVFPMLHKNRLIQFYLHLPEGLFLISAATIHDDTDIAREQEPQGYFFLGRLVDDEFLSTVQAITGTHIELSKPLEKTPEPGRSTINYIYPFLSFKGEIVANAVCSRPISNFESVYRYSRIFILVFFFVGIGSLILIYYLVHQWINKPMDKLVTSLVQDDPGIILSLTDRKDEFARLSKLIMDFYRQKADLSVKIAEHEADKQQLTESEEKFSKAFIFNPTATIITNLGEGRILSANSSFLRLTGYSLQEVKGRTPDELHLYEPEKVKKILPDGLRNDNQMPEYELELRKKGGTFCNVLYKSEFIHLQGVKSLLTVFVDITDRKQAEQTLEAAKHMAEESDRMKNVLLTNISHDLRTPLTSILGFSGLIIEDTQEEGIRNLADKILEASGRMISSLNAIMTLAEIHAGTLRIVNKNLNISTYLESCFAQYREMALRKMIDFRINTEKELFAEVDGNYINQMMQLLLDNAFQFTEQGHVTIDVYESIRDDNSYVTIRVSDTGTGISYEKQQELIAEFASITAGKGGGSIVSGYGLSLVCHLACKMNGTLEMESEPGHGSVFSINFPSKPSRNKHE